MAVLRSTIGPFLTLLAASVAACESALSPSELLTLHRAESLWAARSFQDYAIEMREACFCPDVVSQWARVEVVGGQVTRVTVLATGAEVAANERTYFRTVEQLFSLIRAVSGDDWVEDIGVEFDRELGFPTYVSVVPEPHILDAGGAHYLRNAGPIP
jgi:Family of unknown function (DUF6174)